MIKKELKRKVVRNFELPIYNQVDVKISYACNFKCEYCYQVDDKGKRFKGNFAQENIDNLIKFMAKTKSKYVVNLVGGEPFVYPYLMEFTEKVVKNGHTPNMITNFSAKFEKIEKFLNIVKNNLRGFSISIHISQWENIEDFYEKLDKLVNYKKQNNYDWFIWLTCVITEDNFDKAIEIGDYIKNKYGLNVVFQRVYHNGIYDIYSEKIENYFKEHLLDVKEEQANNIDFYGRYCWAGAKFFYVEYNGDVHRCYTPQLGYKNGILGNLSRYKKIKIEHKPYPCLSKDNGNCVCFKHFVKSKFLTDYMATENEVQKYIVKNDKFRSLFLYSYYRLLSNFAVGKSKYTLIDKKNKYKERLNEK